MNKNHKTLRVVLALAAILVICAAAVYGSGESRAVKSVAAAGQREETDSVNFMPLILDKILALVSIEDQSFTPHAIAVATNDTVRWTNDDVLVHTLVADGVFESPPLDPGDEFGWRPTADGVYHYGSTTNPQMEGQIIASPYGAADWFGGQTVEQAYLGFCQGCHGPDRQGGIGPPLTPDRLTENDQFYFDTITNGRGGMPSWSGIMSPEEIWLMVGFLRSEPNVASTEWNLNDIQESLTVLVDEGTLPPGPTHSGNMDNLMLITEREARRIAVVDGDTHQLLEQIPASFQAHGYAFHPLEERWAYNIGRDGWLFKIDLYSLQAVRKVRAGLDARGLAVSDDGQYLIAGNYIPNSAVILNAQTLEPLKVITTEGLDPDGVFVESRVCITSDVSPALVGPYFILALKDAGQMWRIDYSQPDFPITKLENVGRILHDGFLSPDNSRFYVASQVDNFMAVINVADWSLVTQIPTGATPHPGSGATWEANGVQYGATVHAGEGKVTIWDLANNQIVGETPTSGPGLFIRTQEHNPYIWADTMFADTPNKIYVLNQETFEVVHIIDEGILTLHPELTDDGQFVYVSDWGANIVRVYDAMTFQKVAELHDIVTPTGIFNTSRRHETLGH